MDSQARVVVSKPSSVGKQIEVIQVNQSESYFNIVTESKTIFFSPNFAGRMRCGSKFIDSQAMQPVAAFLSKGFPLVIETPSSVPWLIVHIHDGAVPAMADQRGAKTDSLSFYKVHSGQDFLVANMVEKMLSGGVPEPMLEAFLNELPYQFEPCSDLPAAGNRRLAERLRLRILDAEDKQVNLKEIAEELSCHPSQLSREFRRLFGIAPYKFSFLLRLAKTREWLRKGRDLADIALNFEFSDQSHFTRAFRQIYQMTPNCYRNLYRSRWDLNPRTTL
jgi:AraC-like DNA-binding protein